MIIVSTYLFFNLRGNIGIQGDSGSYFLATTFFILVTNYTQNLNIYHSLIFLCPVLFDVVCTTIVRLILFKNILKPHLNNLYQRVASYNNNHLKSTFSFICFQIIFSLFMLLCLKYKYFDLINYICIFTFILFLWIAYLIHNDKILFKIKVKD